MLKVYDRYKKSFLFHNEKLKIEYPIALDFYFYCKFFRKRSVLKME